MEGYKLTMKKIPEDPSQLEDLFKNIQLKNSSVMTGDKRHTWPSSVSPQLSECVLCDSALSAPQRVPGTDGKSYLLTRVGLLPIVPFIKRCERQTCSARYCYNNWEEGVNYIQFIYSYTQNVHSVHVYLNVATLSIVLVKYCQNTINYSGRIF